MGRKGGKGRKTSTSSGGGDSKPKAQVGESAESAATHTEPSDYESAEDNFEMAPEDLPTSGSRLRSKSPKKKKGKDGRASVKEEEGLNDFANEAKSTEAIKEEDEQEDASPAEMQKEVSEPRKETSEGAGEDNKEQSKTTEEETSAGGWGGWGGGWGSMLAAASSAVENIGNEFVKAADSVLQVDDDSGEGKTKDGNSQGMPRFPRAEEIEAERKARFPRAKEVEAEKKQEKERAGGSENKEDIDEGDGSKLFKDFEASLEKTASAVGSAFKLVTSNVEEKVHSSGLDKIGEDVVSSSLGVLEELGKNTMSVIRKGRTSTSDNDSELVSAKTGFENVYEDKQGNSHREALEILCSQSNIELQQRLFKMHEDVQIQIEEEFEGIENAYDEEEDEKEDSKGTKSFSSFVKKVVSLINSMGYDRRSQSETLESIDSCAQETVKERLKKLTDHLESAGDSPGISELESLFLGLLSEIEKCGNANIAEFTSVCIEIIRKLVEVVLLKRVHGSGKAAEKDENEESGKAVLSPIVLPLSSKEDVFLYISRMRKLSSLFTRHIEFLCSTYTDGLSELHSCVSSKSIDGDKAKDFLGRSGSEVKKLKNRLLVESANGSAHVVDAFESTISIAKLAMVDVFSKY
eukprot:Nk52_evm8s967 gene=Nk52_evmTU8s967